EAVKHRDLDKLKSLAGKDPVKTIAANLWVTVEPGTQVLVLRLKHSDAEDSAKILSAVIEAFDNTVNIRARLVTDDNLEMFIKARNQVATQLDEHRKKYADFRKEQPIRLPIEPRCLAIEQRRIEVVLRRKENELKLEELSKAIESKKPYP